MLTCLFNFAGTLSNTGQLVPFQCVVLAPQMLIPLKSHQFIMDYSTLISYLCPPPSHLIHEAGAPPYLTHHRQSDPHLLTHISELMQQVHLQQATI